MTKVLEAEFIDCEAPRARSSARELEHVDPEQLLRELASVPEQLVAELLGKAGQKLPERGGPMSRGGPPPREESSMPEEKLARFVDAAPGTVMLHLIRQIRCATCSNFAWSATMRPVLVAGEVHHPACKVVPRADRERELLRQWRSR